MFTIGPWVIDKPSILAPMAGVTDLPFRQLCRNQGAGLAVSEMVTSDSRLWRSRKSRLRLVHTEDYAPRSVQLAGNDPATMALAAQMNAAMGAQIIDINMGCPAKKVCKKAAGSALLKDEKLVYRILNAVVGAVDIPVTLKIRTGWDQQNRNGTTIARIAEDSGIQALAVHGRTRACAFKGEVEYDTVKEIVATVDLPVFVNGDITTPEQAREVMSYTGASAVMIGRGAQGNPWIFREINHFLATGKKLAAPTLNEIRQAIVTHLQSLHEFYGEQTGLRIARKHVAWYLNTQAHIWQHRLRQQGEMEMSVAATLEPVLTDQPACFHRKFQQYFNRIESTQQQYACIQSYFDKLLSIEEKAA